MRPWKRERELGPEGGQPAQRAMCNTALGAALGPGVGMTLGLAFWGAQGIPLGLAFGAGAGLAIGAALDEIARRREE